MYSSKIAIPYVFQGCQEGEGEGQIKNYIPKARI